MEITITIPDVLASQAVAHRIPAETYVERLLGRIAAASEVPDRGRAVLRAELACDWEEYRKTGLHLDGGEVDGWLERLEAGESVEPPALHTWPPVRRSWCYDRRCGLSTGYSSDFPILANGGPVMK